VFTYLIALGSNQRHSRHGAPRQVIDAALDALDIPILMRSATLSSRPVGPAQRAYANAAALIETKMTPPELLEHVKAIEANFGRNTRGQRWRARVIDVDIILWSGGLWAERNLAIPHSQFRARDFVLKPLAQIAPDWRDPLTRRTIMQLLTRYRRRSRQPI
jgi:2-amino-4-hydroxy-6-hydroxymethyldihydropteridine diphosphokinase